MDSHTIKLNATHSHLKIRLAEIRFDRTQKVKDIKVVSFVFSHTLLRKF